MSGYPVLLEGRAINALVVGGGRVAARKTLALLGTDARVHLVAASITDELQDLAHREPRLTIHRRPFRDEDVENVTLVIAATSDRATNTRVAQVARARHRLITVVDAPAEGNCAGMATHRSGDVVIGVSAGGVPRAATRIRDAIAARFDVRYAIAIMAVRALRRRLLDTGERARWTDAVTRLLDDRFCARVESGALVAEADAWR